MSNPSRFSFYEKVRIESNDPAKAEINGKLGAILGKAEGDRGWGYAVHVYECPHGWCCWEHELIPTGEFDRRETFYSGDSIRVGPIDAAERQAQIDIPDRDHYHGKLLATEESRFLVMVFFWSDGIWLSPTPVVLYAVSLDCKTAWRVNEGDGAPYGFHPERRK